MLHEMKRSRRRGFTLLEVLLATVIMAVGTTSVLVVIATAAGMASQRQVLLRREQVVDEARHEAQAAVNAFRPAAPDTAALAAGKSGKKQADKVVEPDVAPPAVKGRKSERFDGFKYDLAFEPRDRGVPEKGFDVSIKLLYGGDELSYETSCTILPTLIPEDEFADSLTYREERKGVGSQAKTKEKK